MHFVILVVLVVAVYGRDLSDAGYYPAQPYGRYDRQHINSPLPEIFERRYEENDPNRGNYENDRPVDLNNNRQVFNNENNKELYNNDRNGRTHQFPNSDRRHTHGVIADMDINLAFERQGPKTHREGNMNLPKQSFSINNEYSKKVDVTNDDSNRSYNQNIPTRRDEGDMVFRDEDEDDHDKRKTHARPNNNNSNNHDVPNIGIISFLNNVNISNTNNNINNEKQIKTQPNYSNNDQIEFKSDTVSDTNQRPSTTIENEVTLNPFGKDPNVKENTTVEEKWVWGDGDKMDTETTTDITTPTDLDDRAAFEGGKCATGMARVQGKCVATD